MSERATDEDESLTERNLRKLSRYVAKDRLITITLDVGLKTISSNFYFMLSNLCRFDTFCLVVA